MRKLYEIEQDHIQLTQMLEELGGDMDSPKFQEYLKGLLDTEAELGKKLSRVASLIRKEKNEQEGLKNFIASCTARLERSEKLTSRLLQLCERSLIATGQKSVDTPYGRLQTRSSKSLWKDDDLDPSSEDVPQQFVTVEEKIIHKVDATALKKFLEAEITEGGQLELPLGVTTHKDYPRLGVRRRITTSLK